MTAPDAPAVVLVVDDTRAKRVVAGSWLRRQGHDVLEAGTGEEALAVLRGQQVDLVVLDVGLPDISGFDVCEQIKSDPHLAHPVVHLSATSIRGTDRAHGLNRGADAYLTEPVEPAELVATVAAVLRYYRARDDARRLAGRLGRLTGATLAMHGATAFDELATAIAAGSADVLDVPVVAVVGTPNGPVRATVLDPATGRAELDTPPAGLAVRLSVHRPAGSVGLPFAVPAGLPAPGDDDRGPDWTVIELEGRGTGSPGLIAVRGAQGNPEDTDLLVQLGNAAALAAEALRLSIDEHNLALTLQRSFLPSRLPDRPGLEVAVRYQPAADNAEIGGDFYEMVELDGGRLLIAVGDVAGHSIHAATVMVELRHALRAYAAEGHPPAEILTLLEQVLRQYHPLEFSTLCLAELDHARNQVAVANAGHLPPLLVEDGKARYLPVRGPMLGLRRPHPEATVQPLSRAWTLVLVTDGLVEAPGTDLDDALEALRLAVAVDLPPEELCARLLERFGESRRDDVALLVLRGRT